MRLAWKEKLYEAPLEDPQRILDIGTGTGIWAIEMADKFPMAEVIGTDLSPIQPSWMPTNWYTSSVYGPGGMTLIFGTVASRWTMRRWTGHSKA